MTNDTVGDVAVQFQALLEQGKQLQTLFASEHAIEPKHISIIRGWINTALDIIEPAMPPDNAEFRTLTEIRQTYSNVAHVLPGDTSEHLGRILTALSRAYQFFLAWCKCDFSQMGSAVRARACHKILDETWRFTRDQLTETLRAKEDGRTKRTALLHSYGRMYCWVHSMIELGNDGDAEIPIAEHALALAACLRAIFEVFLDMRLLREDRIKQGPEKFFSFEKVARVRIAKKSLELDDAYQHLNDKQRSRMTAYESTEASVEGKDGLIARLWGLTAKGKPSRPEHWTGMTVIDRVKNLGGECIRYYQHTYHYCNWSLHSGYVEFLMKTEENASLFCALTYSFAHAMFLRATLMMIEEFAEFIDVPISKEQLKKAELRGAHVLWDAAVRAEAGEARLNTDAS